MKKNISKKLKNKLDSFNVDLVRLRRKREEKDFFSKRVSNEIIDDYKEQFKDANNKKDKKVADEAKIDFRTYKLIADLKNDSLASAIGRAIHLFQQLDVYSSIKRYPSDFNRDIIALEKSLLSVQKQIRSFYVFEFLLSYQGELETIEFEESINETLKVLIKRKDDAISFQQKYDENFNIDFFKENKSNTDDRKKLTILCTCLNHLYEGDQSNLKTNFLSVLSERLISKINIESKMLNVKEINLGDEVPYFDMVDESLRSASWKALVKNRAIHTMPIKNS